ncbi:hypothetical protein D9C73_003199 [Collichthys lucidus]|uniref:Uncharacterized protein n=1 Tax=Collichthys lucidus TaxID=240159 RepID=A0A4U5U812_COLLU|nr:hypothetical protein D9C73_003199 [Collichthys lucidus]
MGSAPQTAKGTKKGPSPPPPHSSPPPLRSPILQGADSSKIRKPASPPPAQPHFLIITTTTKNKALLMTVGSQGPAGARVRIEGQEGLMCCCCTEVWAVTMAASTSNTKVHFLPPKREATSMTNRTEEEEEEEREKENRERDGAEERYFVCIELTHVTIVKSPRDTWLPFRGAPVLCVIHVVIEEPLLLAQREKEWEGGGGWSEGEAFLPGTVEWGPCQVLSVQGYLPGTDILAVAQTTTADCLLLCPTVCLGGISGHVSLHHTVCSPSLTMSRRQHPFLYPIPNESSHGTLFHDGEKEGKSENTYCLAGRLRLRSCEGERGEEGGGGGGGRGDSAVIQFTILAVAFFSLCGHGGDRRSQQALRTLAGRSPTQKPHGQRKKEKKTELSEGEVAFDTVKTVSSLAIGRVERVMSLHTICQDTIRLHRSIQGPVSDLIAFPLFNLRRHAGSWTEQHKYSMDKDYEDLK